MLKKCFLGAAFAALAAGGALAANLPLVSGPVDPGNAIATINGVVQSVNTGVDGNLSTLVTSSATTLTTIQPLFTYIAPGGQLSSVGQLMHVKAWGVNSADANAKTITFAYGAATCAQVVTGSGNTWVEDFYVIKTGAATQTYMCDGITSTTVVAAVEGTGTNTDSAATTVTVSGTAATSGTITVAGAYVEQLK